MKEFRFQIQLTFYYAPHGLFLPFDFNSSQ